MDINADFNARVVVHSASMPWLDSPMPGVRRRPLDRVGEEVARATSIVQYAPNSQFSHHVHTGGEEFLVLDGIFQDEHGDFPAGSYIRNPPQSNHTPGSKPGCVIFVKLWQFDPHDQTHIRLHTDFMQAVPHQAMPGVSVIPLYHDEYETVSMQIWQSNTVQQIDAQQGIELLVLAGTVTEGQDILVQHSWLRAPCESDVTIKSGPEGAKIWVKQHHMPYVDAQIDRVSQQK